MPTVALPKEDGLILVALCIVIVTSRPVLWCYCLSGKLLMTVRYSSTPTHTMTSHGTILTLLERKPAHHIQLRSNSDKALIASDKMKVYRENRSASFYQLTACYSRDLQLQNASRSWNESLGFSTRSIEIGNIFIM